jgi:RNA polymerase sigma-70 factor (ECF subfamily)
MIEMQKNPDAPSEIDSGLVRAFQAGESSAFDRIVLRHKTGIFNLCYWYLGDYQEANDMAQVTFMKAFQSLHGFRYESAFSTWLHRIAINNCKNRIKSWEYRAKRRTLPLDNPGHAEANGPSAEMEDGAPSPMAVLEQKERNRLIRKALHSLGQEQREIITLRDIQGLSYEEITDITGLNPGTVKSKLARARLELKERLRSVIGNGL